MLHDEIKKQLEQLSQKIDRLERDWDRLDTQARDVEKHEVERELEGLYADQLNLQNLLPKTTT